MRKATGILIALLFFISASNAEETQYTNNSFARLSYVKGDIYVQRSTDLGYEEGVVNMPISEGDRMGTTDGRAEIYLGNGNYVRLDNETKIDFITLPDKTSELIRIRVWTGHIYFRVSGLEEEKSIEIHTPDVSIYVLDNGLYRIDVRQGSETEIFVYEGMLEAAVLTDGANTGIPRSRSAWQKLTFLKNWKIMNMNCLRTANGFTCLHMGMYGYPEGLTLIGDHTTTADGHGFLDAAGPGFHTSPGVGAPTTTADGIGDLVSVGTGSQPLFGDLLG